MYVHAGSLHESNAYIHCDTKFLVGTEKDQRWSFKEKGQGKENLSKRVLQECGHVDMVAASRSLTCIWHF